MGFRAQLFKSGWSPESLVTGQLLVQQIWGGGDSNKPLERLPWVTWRSDLRDEGCEHQTHTAAVCLCADDRPQQIMRLSFIWTA